MDSLKRYRVGYVETDGFRGECVVEAGSPAHAARRVILRGHTVVEVVPCDPLETAVDTLFRALAEIPDGTETCTRGLWAAATSPEFRDMLGEDDLARLDGLFRRQALRRGWLLGAPARACRDPAQPCDAGFTVARLPVTRVEYSESDDHGRSAAFVVDGKALTFAVGEGAPCGGKLVWRPRRRIWDAARFAALFGDCQFLSWLDAYDEPEISDGVQWSARIKSGRRVLRKTRGANIWPDRWDAVARLLDFLRCEVELGPCLEDDDEE